MLFIVIMMCYFSLRSLVEPFWAILMYYALAVFRPQAIWEWALSGTGGEGMRWSLIAAIVTGVVFFLNLGNLRPRVVRKRFILLILLYSFCLSGSYYCAVNHEVAGLQGWEYFKIMLILLLACFVVTERWHMRYLAWMIFFCLIYQVYEINYNYLFKQRLDIFHQGFGGMDNNGAALMIAMVIPFSYYFFLAERRWWRWGYLACILPAAHAVMLTYSRGAMLSCIVVVVGMLLESSRKKFIQTAIIGVCMASLVLTMAGNQVRARFFSIQDNKPGSSQESRFRSWRAGWEIAKDNPIFGVGLRNSNLFTKDYGADMEGRTIHNNYIQIASDSGFPAAAVFLSLLFLTFWWLRKGARLARKQIDSYEYCWHHHICLASFWSMALFAFGSIFLSFETFELCYLLMLFGAIAPVLGTPPDEEIQPILQTPGIKRGLPLVGSEGSGRMPLNGKVAGNKKEISATS